MPYKSDAQRRFFHANKKKLEAQGVNVAEWDAASKGKKLPERAPKKSASVLPDLLCLTRQLILQEKEAEPYWQKGIRAQMSRPQWSPDASFVDNVVSNVHGAGQKAQSMIAGEDSADDIRSATQPDFALQRALRYIRHGDRVKDPVDRVLFRGDSPI